MFMIVAFCFWNICLKDLVYMYLYVAAADKVCVRVAGHVAADEGDPLHSVYGNGGVCFPYRPEGLPYGDPHAFLGLGV